MGKIREFFNLLVIAVLISLSIIFMEIFIPSASL